MHPNITALKHCITENKTWLYHIIYIRPISLRKQTHMQGKYMSSLKFIGLCQYAQIVHDKKICCAFEILQVHFMHTFHYCRDRYFTTPTIPRSHAPCGALVLRDSCSFLWHAVKTHTLQPSTIECNYCKLVYMAQWRTKLQLSITMVPIKIIFKVQNRYFGPLVFVFIEIFNISNSQAQLFSCT